MLDGCSKWALSPLFLVFYLTALGNVQTFGSTLMAVRDTETDA
jgi:hypothetical protein